MWPAWDSCAFYVLVLCLVRLRVCLWKWAEFENRFFVFICALAATYYTDCVRPASVQGLFRSQSEAWLIRSPQKQQHKTLTDWLMQCFIWGLVHVVFKWWQKWYQLLLWSWAVACFGDQATISQFKMYFFCRWSCVILALHVSLVKNLSGALWWGHLLILPLKCSGVKVTTAL